MNNKTVVNVFCFFIYAVGLTLYIFDDVNLYVWLVPLSINVMYCVVFRKCIPISLMFIFFTFYSWQNYHFFIENLYISAWMDFQTPTYLNKVAMINATFLLMLGTSLTSVKIEFPDISLYMLDNKIIFFSCMIMTLIFFHFGLSGDSIFVGGYGVAEIHKTPMYEYSLVFMLVGAFFSGFKTRRVVCFNVIGLAFVIKGFLYGGRIEALQAILLIAYFNYNFFKSYNLKLFYSLSFVGIVFLTFLGKVRSNLDYVNFLIENPLYIFKSTNKYIISSNYGDIIQASARIVGLVDEGFWDLSFRINSFLSYLFNLLLFNSDFKNLQNLALIDQDIYGAGGGGMLPVYFYGWLGYLGVLFSGLVISLLFYTFFKYKGRYIYIYMFSILISFPRWYGYGPIGLVKFSLITLMIYFFAYAIYPVLSNKKYN